MKNSGVMLALSGLATWWSAACGQAEGVASVTRALAGRYGERSFDLDVNQVQGGGTTVRVTLAGADLRDDASREARGIAHIVQREFPLEGERDSVIVRLSASGEEGAVRTERALTHRFAATDLAAEP